MDKIKTAKMMILPSLVLIGKQRYEIDWELREGEDEVNEYTGYVSLDLDFRDDREAMDYLDEMSDEFDRAYSIGEIKLWDCGILTIYIGPEDIENKLFRGWYVV